jgi:hypothetical protein
MGFWDEVKVGLQEAGARLMVRQEVEQLAELSKPVARREMKHKIEDLDDEGIQRWIEILDSLASQETGQIADTAAEFAEFAESFLRDRN